MVVVWKRIGVTRTEGRTEPKRLFQVRTCTQSWYFGGFLGYFLLWSGRFCFVLHWARVICKNARLLARPLQAAVEAVEITATISSVLFSFSKQTFPLLKFHCFPNAAFYTLPNDSQAELQGQNLSLVDTSSYLSISYIWFSYMWLHDTLRRSFFCFSIKYTWQPAFLWASTGAAPCGSCYLLHLSEIYSVFLDIYKDLIHIDFLFNRRAIHLTASCLLLAASMWSV